MIPQHVIILEYMKNLERFKSWEEGGLLKIILPRNKAIRISKHPIFSLTV